VKIGLSRAEERVCEMNDIRDLQTLEAVLRRQAQRQPNATALIFRNRTTSYVNLDTHASQVANGLVDFGIRHENRVGYLGKNSDVYFELLFGTARSGAVLVPLNWRLAAPEVAAIIADAEISTLFVGSGFGTIATALDTTGGLRCISIDGASRAWQDFAAWRDKQSASDRRTGATAKDTVLQIYTSGTTGSPKGVELTNGNYLALLAALALGGPGDLDPGDVVLVCMPVFHVAGTGMGLCGLAHGSGVVVMEEFDAAELAVLILRHHVTCLILVPAAIMALTQHPSAATAGFGSVRILSYGASPIAEALVEQARDMFANAGLYHLYGLTETAGGGTILPPEAHDPARGKLRSCGRPCPGFELRIIDLNGEPVPVGVVGEIVLRSETVMKGYYNKTDATRDAFTADGWLRTGDAAYVDAEGFVYVHDRVEDMIVSGGENVYPAEVENALFDHPAVADVAVIGVPDTRWGEAVKAIVVLRPGQTASAEEIVDHARARIASYKLPKSIDFVESLPRNPTGKVLKRTLRAPYWEAQDRQIG
jgi:acyl-CoA synthetase (AMP-forming)/AMP-acid ligase II